MPVLDHSGQNGNLICFPVQPAEIGSDPTVDPEAGPELEAKILPFATAQTVGKLVTPKTVETLIDTSVNFLYGLQERSQIYVGQSDTKIGPDTHNSKDIWTVQSGGMESVLIPSTRDNGSIEFIVGKRTAKNWAEKPELSSLNEGELLIVAAALAIAQSEWASGTALFEELPEDHPSRAPASKKDTVHRVLHRIKSRVQDRKKPADSRPVLHLVR